jgi:hypothetical protein
MLPDFSMVFYMFSTLMAWDKMHAHLETNNAGGVVWGRTSEGKKDPTLG